MKHSAYYNENDPFAAAWLRELIRNGLIAAGEVDERSIEDVPPNDLRGFTQCHFFAGIGVWSYALRKAGWADEREVWTGSCPCQPFSSAGEGKGSSDARHLWPAFHWLISQCRPDVIFGEQVARKPGEHWFDHVQSDLAAQGFTAGAVVFPACGVGAPHIRNRLYWVGHSERAGLQGQSKSKRSPSRRQTLCRSSAKASICNGAWQPFHIISGNGYRKPIQPGTFPLVDGAPARVGRMRGYGNAIVAQQALAFINAFLDIESKGAA